MLTMLLKEKIVYSLFSLIIVMKLLQNFFNLLFYI